MEAKCVVCRRACVWGSTFRLSLGKIATSQCCSVGAGEMATLVAGKIAMYVVVGVASFTVGGLPYWGEGGGGGWLALSVVYMYIGFIVCAQTPAHMHIHTTHMRACTHTHVHTYAPHTHTRTHTRTLTHTHTHARTHARTHAHTHTHVLNTPHTTHTQLQGWPCFLCPHPPPPS